MNEIEKAIFAINLVESLLLIEKKILAIKFIRLLYGTNLKPAYKFVTLLQRNQNANNH